MKSVAIGWAAEIGRFIFVSASLIFAFSLLIVGIHLRRKHRLILPLFVVAATLMAWLPFWGYFPGLLLASKICDHTGGVRVFDLAPIQATSIIYSSSQELKASTIAELLARNGFDTVEEQFASIRGNYQLNKWKGEHPGSGAILAYKIADIGSPKCDAFRDAVTLDFGLATGVYQHGLRHNQCLTIERRTTSQSQIAYKVWTREQWFPIHTTISHAGFYRANSNNAVIESKSFYYYAANPYLGGIPHVNCASDRPEVLDVPMTIARSQAQRQHQKSFFVPRLKESQLRTTSVTFQDFGVDYFLDLNTISSIRRKVLGFDMEDAHVWLASPDSGTNKDLLILTN